MALMQNELYTIGALGLVVIILFIWLISLETKLHKLLRGKEKNLDDVLGNIRKDIDALKDFSKKSAGAFQIIDKKLSRTVSGNETVRFNPFQGAGLGGNQSFATALVNSEGDGVIISSLYSRDRVSIFSKPIKKFASEYELTNEEKEALQKARDSLL
jgi:hypothetical protein